MPSASRLSWLNSAVQSRIAVIAGDGIGKEVTAEAVKILDTIGGVDLHHLPWGADHYLRPDARASAILAAVLRCLAETLSPASTETGVTVASLPR